MVLFWAAAASLPDLDGLGAGDDVPGGQVLGHGSVPLHETLALGVDQETALSSAPLCDGFRPGWVTKFPSLLLPNKQCSSTAHAFFGHS